MSNPSDRNLLFGILALQMDFITRDQLVAGMHSPSKQQCWQERTPISEEERDTFLLTLAINRAQHLLAKAGPLTKQQTKTLERQSVAQTLVELGHLIIYRRPNTTPKKEQKADRIS